MLAGGVYERTSRAAGQPLGAYRRRMPERTVLHELVAGHAQTMFAEHATTTPGVPGCRATWSASSPSICGAAFSRTGSPACAARRATTTSTWCSRASTCMPELSSALDAWMWTEMPGTEAGSLCAWK